MLERDKRNKPDNLPPVDEEQFNDLGVMCLFIYRDADTDKLLLTSLPKEDVEGVSKYEKLRHMMNLVLLGEHMLSFPGGKIEKDESPEVALHREVFEEIGIVLDESRLQPLTTEPFEVNQTKEGDENRPGDRLFQVTGFSYRLNDAELAQIKELMRGQNRRVALLTLPEAKQLDVSQIRPSSQGLLDAYNQTLT